MLDHLPHIRAHSCITQKCLCKVLNRRSNLRGCLCKASRRRAMTGCPVSPAPVSWLYQSQFSPIWNTEASTWVVSHAQNQSLDSRWLGLTVCRAEKVESEIEGKPDTHHCLRLQIVLATLCSCACLSQEHNKLPLIHFSIQKENNTFIPSSLPIHT